LGDNDLNSLLKKNLVQGKVIKLLLYFPNTSSWYYKRIILLNKDFNNSEVYYVLTTSRTQKFIKSKYKEIVGNFVFVPKGKTLDNKDEDFIIDLRSVFCITKDKLIKSLKNQKIEFLNPIPTDLLEELKRKIKVSFLILDIYKEKIL